METEQDAPAKQASLTSLIWLSLTQEVQRDVLGMDACRMSIIGAQRRKLGAVTTKSSPTMLARNNLVGLLKEVCTVCPHAECDMKDWVFID